MKKSSTSPQVPTGEPKTAKKSLWSNPWTYIGLLTLIVIGVFWEFLFSDKMLYGSDTMGGLDARVLMRETLSRSLAIPQWFSSRLGGMPTIDAMFGDAFYPPTLISMLAGPVHRILGLRLVFHVLLAGVFFFILLYRGFRTSPFVAFVGATFYMLNTQFFSHIYPGHDGKMFVIAWLPFVVWRLKALMDLPSILNSVLLGLGIAMCLLTSHIQMTYFMLWGVFLYWVVATVLLWRKGASIGKLTVPALAFWGAVAIGMGLAFVQLYPSFMYVREAFSVRGVDRGFEYAASWSLHWPEAFSLWIPEFCGMNVQNVNTYWSENAFKLNSEYAGAMALLFGICAIALKRKPWRLFWGSVSILALLYSLGAHTPVFHLAYALVPGVKKFRAGSMIMFWFSFGMILLSSLFFKDIESGIFSSFSEEKRKKWSRGILIAAASCVGLALLFSMKDLVAGVMGIFTQSLMDPRKQQLFTMNFSSFTGGLWLWAFMVLAALGFLWGVIEGKFRPRTFVWVVLLLGIVDLLRVNMQFVNTMNHRSHLSALPELDELRNEMKTEPFRVFSFPGTFQHQNAEGIQGLEGVDGFHDNELRWYREFRGEQNLNYFSSLLSSGPDGQSYLVPENLRTGNPFLNIANAKYYLLRQGPQIRVIPNQGALGRISFADKYVVGDSSRIRQMLLSGEYDYRTTVALEKEPETKPQSANDTLSTSPFSVKWEEYSPNQRKARVFAPRDGFLRISEVHYPGWKIEIDGKKVPILRSDLSWMAISVSAGEHTITMKPESLYLSKAMVVTLSVLGLCFALCAGSLLLRRRKVSSAAANSTTSSAK